MASNFCGDGANGQGTEQEKTGQDHLSGHFRWHFRGKFRGSFRGEGALVGAFVGALVGGLVGGLVCFRLLSTKSPEFPQKGWDLGSEIAVRNCKSLAIFHCTPLNHNAALLCLVYESLAKFWGLR